MNALPPPSEGRVYRPGATIILLNPPPGFEARGMAILMTVVAILFGPVAFFVHLIRLCLVWVSVDPNQGLLFSSGRAVPWEEIRSVELKASVFKGIIRASPLMFFISMGCWAVTYFVVLPSVALFTPWHGRVIIALKAGETIVLRDLGSAERFAAEVSQGIQPLPAAP